MIDPDKCYLSISKTAGVLLRRLGICPEGSYQELRNRVVGSCATGDVQIVKETKEMHFLAKASISGVSCYLICVTREGSPASKQPYTTIIKGVMLPSDAEELIGMGKGMAPIGRQLSLMRNE